MLWHGKNFRGIINKAKEMIFDNTGTDLISTNAEDAIKEVNSNLSKHTLGTIVNITSYNPSNPYICPSDGYIRVTSGGVGGEQFAMMDGLALGMVIGTSTEPICRLSVFVRKGSAISTQSNSISGTGEFIPLT